MAVGRSRARLDDRAVAGRGGSGAAGGPGVARSTPHASTATVGPPPASAPRWAAWSIPNAAPEPTAARPAPVRHPARRPGRCRRWSPTGTPPTATRVGSSSRRSGPGPTGRAGRRHRLEWLAPASWSRAAGHSESPGTTQRMPRRRCAVEVAPGLRSSRRAAASVRSPWVTIGQQRSVHGSELQDTRPAIQSPGSPGSARAGRAGRRSPGPPHRGGQQGLAGAQPERDLSLATPGRSTPARSATSQRAGHPGQPAAGQPALPELVLDQPGRRRSHRPPGHQRRPRRLAVEPPRLVGIALACRRGPTTLARTRALYSRAASGSRRAVDVSAVRCRVMSIRSVIGPVTLRR